MELNREQIISFNHLMRGWVMNNKYLQKATQNYDLIALHEGGKTVRFNLGNLSVAYQQKFVLKNFDLYCTQLFLAVKPQFIVFLKNEGITSYNFHLIFLAGNMVCDKMETVSTWKSIDLYNV
ncbi:hypothetical protein ABIE26_005117 [Pedobacter africanus]|uniref:Uncharacterized protein n=1 Tax=Pedobacter africanus TaxID=151894 RepID=A0ACC6L4T1_9SPHI|nr:hypothetical protein [Pedobacter africanus]MDR6786398.1 hypothetical protein [Pedobacter africanus]